MEETSKTGAPMHTNKREKKITSKPTVTNYREETNTI